MSTGNADPITITSRIERECQVLMFDGVLVYQNLQDAKKVLNTIFEDTEGYILDFSNLKKIDSTGFGLIFNIIKRKPEKAKIVSVVSDMFIRELFNITKIDKLIPIKDSIAEALEELCE